MLTNRDFLPMSRSGQSAKNFAQTSTSPLPLIAVARALSACAAILAGTSASATAAPITYYISTNIWAQTITGTITTDGTMGVLAENNILYWSVTISFAGASHAFNQSRGGSLSISGRDLTASPMAISFNFGDINPATAGSFLFSDSSYSTFWGSSEFVYCSGRSNCGGAGQEGSDLEGRSVVAAYPMSAEVIAFRFVYLPFPYALQQPYQFSHRFHHVCHGPGYIGCAGLKHRAATGHRAD
jgi:hypothetical protein